MIQVYYMFLLDALPKTHTKVKHNLEFFLFVESKSQSPIYVRGT